MSGDERPDNIEGFHRFLDIINYEPKAWTFLNLEDRPATIMDMTETANRSPGLEVHIDKRNIYRHLRSIAGAGDGSLAVTSTVRGRIRGTAKAWNLTPLGQFLKPAVAFAMPFLPSRYGISSWDVIGPMNSRYERRGSYGRVDVIRSLSLYDTRTIGQMSEFTGIKPAEVVQKLGHLSNVALGSKRYPEGLPFVEPVQGTKAVQDHVYQWTGKEFDPGDFMSRWPELEKLARIFTGSDQGSFFQAKSIFDGSGYGQMVNMTRALGTLEEKGYVSSYVPKDFRSYKLTADGKSYDQECLSPVRGYLYRDPGYAAFVLNRQPSEDELMEATKVGTLLRQ